MKTQNVSWHDNTVRPDTSELLRCIIYTRVDELEEVYWNGKIFLKQMGYDSEFFEHIKDKDIICWILFDDIRPVKNE